MKSINDIFSAAALAGAAEAQNEDLVKYTSSKRVTITDMFYNLYEIGSLNQSYNNGVCVYNCDSYMTSFKYEMFNKLEGKIKTTFTYWTDDELSHLYGLFVILDNELYFALPDILERQDSLKILKILHNETGFKVNSIMELDFAWYTIK